MCDGFRVEVRVDLGWSAALGGGPVGLGDLAAGRLLPCAGWTRAVPPALPDHTRRRYVSLSQHTHVLYTYFAREKAQY